jgi:hypothetical protein
VRRHRGEMGVGGMSGGDVGKGADAAMWVCMGLIGRSDFVWGGGCAVVGDGGTGGSARGRTEGGPWSSVVV